MKNIINSSVGASLRTAQNNSANAQPRRKPQRLPDFDYSAEGAYFVTILTKGKRHVLGKILGKEIKLNETGDIVKRTWFDLPDHYPSVTLDEFIVMPNHVHGIIWILSESTLEKSVGAGLKPALTKPTLSEIVRGFKTFSARKVNELKFTSGKSFWHRGYHEHIIRNSDDLYQHRAYIQNNPLKWSLDQYYQ